MVSVKRVVYTCSLCEEGGDAVVCRRMVLRRESSLLCEEGDDGGGDDAVVCHRMVLWRESSLLCEEGDGGGDDVVVVTMRWYVTEWC